jgi:quinol monooxygenase YgiN
MHNIQVSAKFPHVSSANLADFKKVALEALEIAQREPGVLQYDWFFDDDDTVCVVLETYQDAEALREHISNVGETFGRLVELGGGCELEVFGALPAELDETPAGLRRTVFSTHFQGTRH